MKSSIVLIMIAILTFGCASNRENPQPTQYPESAIITGNKTYDTSNKASISGRIIDSEGQPLIGANVQIKGSSIGTVTDIDGAYAISIPSNEAELVFSYVGYEANTIKVAKDDKVINLSLKASTSLDEIVVTGYSNKREKSNSDYAVITQQHMLSSSIAYEEHEPKLRIHPGEWKHTQPVDINSEQYGKFVENKFINPLDEALSTFSIDVDRASYSNIRRFVENGELPPKDAIRIEEMINYFNYDYPSPTGNDPLAVHTLFTDCGWNTDHKILHIGLQGKKIETENLPPSNLVFLIDVSGSMNAKNKLPLLKSSFKMLLNNLRAEDKVAIVTYAGQASVALESTSANEKEKILNALENLGAGGSTAGAQGIKTAYKIAKSNFIDEGNNRIILATDGDFNVGINSNDDLEDLIEKERKSGVFLSVLGYGMGNYKDEQMQTLANKGNGNHAYIDNILEARKILVNEFGGTLFTIAKDVKLQVEFNPAMVSAYRLIGYENRLLHKEDFNNDKKDAGELGAGHVVTAMYEVVMVGDKSDYVGKVDDLKYQTNKQRPTDKNSDELATIKFRYKQPDEDVSKKIVKTVSPSLENDPSQDVKFSLAVAEFGMYLRDSDYLLNRSLDNIIAMSESGRGKDTEGYRAEFIRIVKTVKELKGPIAEK